MIEQKKSRNKHPVIAEIKNRWSPRAFSDKPVSDEKLLSLMEAARWAPSSRNEQPWRFLIARKQDKHYQRLFEALNEYNQRWAFTAPVIGATLAAKKHERNSTENIYRLHDVGLAMGNLLAQATHMGLHVHQMAGIHPEIIVKNFGIDTEEYEVVAMFVLGYQDEKHLDELEEKYREAELNARSRKELSEMVYGRRWGENPEWLE